MDPVVTIANCHVLYSAVQEMLATVKSNRHQFELLKIQLDHIREPLKQLEKLRKEGHLPCSVVVLEDFHKILEEIAQFVSQKRFQVQTAGSSALRWLSEVYNSSEDQAQFIEFDKRIGNHMQSLNLHVTVQLLDFARAAHQDAAKADAEVHSMELRMIDMKTLVWDPSKTKNVIGMGTFSNVIVGQYNKEYVAIKQLRVGVDKMTPSDLKTIQKEAMIMQYANHRNILAIKGANLSKGIIVMELAVCSLSDYLYHADPTAQERARPLLAAAAVPTLQWRVDVIRDVSDAVRYLHAHNILHRDIKSRNVLLFRDPSTGVTTAKLGDFGLALAVELASRTAGTAPTTGPAVVHRAVGTYSYMAPELFDREPGKRMPYSEASDVYSLGVLVNEVISGRTPWEVSARETDIQNWVLNKRLRPKLWDLNDAGTGAGDAGAGMAQRLRDLLGHSDGLHCCWSHQPQQRCSANDVFVAATAVPSIAVPNEVLAQLAAETAPLSIPVEAAAVPSSVPASPNPGSDKNITSSTSQQSGNLLFGWFSFSRIPATDKSVDHLHDPEVVEKREELALHLMQTFPDIPSSCARRYAAALFAASVYTVSRLLQLIQEKGKSDAEFTKWATGLGISTFDAMDMKEYTGSAPVLNSGRSFVNLEAQHGADRLVEWLAQHVPDLPLQSKRRRVAELLCEAGVTCAARLVRRVRDVEWLVKLGVDRLDAEDIVAAAAAPQGSSSKPSNLGGPDTEQSMLADFAADLRCEVPDMAVDRAQQYCADLFPCCIYTVNRLLRVVKKRGAPFLKKLKWHDFDAEDSLYLSSISAEQVTRTPLPEVDQLHGLEVVSLWMLNHVPNIALSSIRATYCKALLQHNVSTVQRLARHGCSEAWLVSIGISQLDAKDIVAALKPLHDKDPVVVQACALQEKAAAAKRAEEQKREAEVAAAQKAAAAEREQNAALRQVRKEERLASAREKFPAKAWKDEHLHRYACCKPWCEFLLEPDHIQDLVEPCHCLSGNPLHLVGCPCVYPFYCGLCCLRLAGCEVDYEFKTEDVTGIGGLCLCLPVLFPCLVINTCDEACKS